MKVLKITIAVMSLLIIAAVILIVFTVAGGFKKNPTSVETYHASVQMPGDCQPAAVLAIIQDLIVLSTKGTDCPELIVIRPASGQVVGEWQFKNKTQ